MIIFSEKVFNVFEIEKFNGLFIIKIILIVIKLIKI